MILAWLLSVLMAQVVLDREVVEVHGGDVEFARWCAEAAPDPREWSRWPDSAFGPVRGERLQFGEQRCWILLRIPVEVRSPGTWYVQNGFAPLDRLMVCAEDSCSSWGGADLPFADRQIGLARLTLPVELSRGTTTVHLLARDTSGSCNVPIHFVPSDRLAEWSEQLALFDGSILGVLLVLFLAACSAAAVFRRPVLAVYALLLGTLLAYIATHTHFAGAHLWPGTPWVNRWAQGFLKVSMTATMGVFAYLWLHLGRYDRRLAGLHLALVATMYALALGMLLRALGVGFLDPLYAARLPEIVGLTLIGLGPLRAVALAIRKHRRAREFLWANLPLGITGFWSVLHVIDGFGVSYFLRSRIMLLGPILEASLLGWFLFTQLGRQRLRQMELLRRHRDLEKEHSRVRTEVADRERRGLARDLHDDLGQRVAGMRLLLEAAPIDPSRMEALRAGMKGVHASLRELARTMHPVELERIGLPDAVERLDTTGESGLAVEVKGDWSTVRGGQAIHLYRIIQECWSNAIRHGGAKSFRVVLVALPERLEVEVADDGSGFDPATVAPGLGLAGIRERVAILDGDLTLESAPGRGTRWTFGVPRG